MKKNSLYSVLLAFAAVMFVVSCQKDQVQDEDVIPSGPEQQEVELVPMTFTCTAEGVTPASEETKVYFNNLAGKDYSQKWSEGDAVAIFSSGSTKSELTVSSIENSHAVFSGSAGSAPYRVIYPYSAAGSISTNTITATLPSVQTAGTNGTDPGALLAVGYAASGTNLQFKNVFGLIQIELTETNVTSIIIEGNNGEDLAGTFTVDASSDAPACTVNSGVKQVVLNPSGETFAAGTYAVAVFPQEFTKGFKVLYKTSGTAKCSIKSVASSTGLTISRSHARYYSHSKLQPGTCKYYYLLNKADLDAWNGDYSNWDASDVVYLGADIDYDRGSWSCVNFAGTFDGRKHKIYNIKMVSNGARTGFFYNMTGTVKNVCFGSSDFDFSSGEGTYDAYSTIDHTSTSTSWNYAGAIAYCGNNGVIDNVVNFCALNVDTACNAGDTRVAGIAGTMKSDATIKNCVNFGDITINSTNFKSRNSSSYDVAGIVSRTDGTGNTITNCTNHGNILSYNTYIANYGGVLASLMNDSTISDLHNTGNITLAGSSQDTYLFIGGVIGNINLSTKQESSIADCSNTGNIVTPSCTSTATSCPSVGLGGVIGRIAGKSVAGLNNIDNAGSITNKIAGPASDTLGIRLGGLVGYSHQEVTSGVDSESKNTGDVINNANTGNKAYLGGIVGYVQASFAVSAENTGAVTNTGTVADRLCMAGIMAAGTSGSTHTATNRGNVTNNGAVTGNSVYMGGIMGYNSGQYTFNTCYNYGDIINEGAAQKCCIGGVSGIMDNRLNIMKCEVNSATIKNTAAITDTLSIGGLVGEYYRSRTSNTLQVSFNTNKVDGASHVINTADAGVICMGGQIGNHCGVDEPDGQRAGYEKAECNAELNNSGNATKGNIYIGGITGVMHRNCKSFGSSDNPNAFGGSITNTGSAPDQASVEGATDNFYVLIGGVIGAFDIATTRDTPFDFKYCSSTGSINVNVTTSTDAQLFVGGICARVLPEHKVIYDGVENSGDITITSFVNTGNGTDPYFTYIGGICGNGPLAAKSCRNTGNIKIDAVSSTPQKIRVGGIGAYYNATVEGLEISNCSSECNISVGNCHSCFAGGIFGDHRRTNGCSVSGCSYKGKIYVDSCTQGATSETGSSVGGIFGSNYNMTFNNCTVNANISGPINSNNGYGLLSGGIAGSANRTMTLGTGDNICTVVAGSVCGSTTIDTSTELTKQQLVGIRRNSYISVSPSLTKGTTYQIVAQ